MTRIIDDYLREVENHLQVGPSQRQRILDELRGHLYEKVDDLRNREAALSLDDAQRRAVGDFGSPQELALSFDVAGPTLETKSGRTVLRVGRAVGRGTGRILKFIAVSVAVLLVLAIGIGIWAFYEVRPYVEDMIQRESTDELYSFHQHCQDQPCDGDAFSQAFFVPDSAHDLTANVWVYTPRDVAGQGSVHLRITDPDGNEHYNRSLAGNDETYEALSWQTLPGTWRVTIDFDGFVGVADFEVHAKGTGPSANLWT